jgi:hypothetical protein
MSEIGESRQTLPWFVAAAKPRARPGLSVCCATECRSAWSSSLKSLQEMIVKQRFISKRQACASPVKANAAVDLINVNRDPSGSTLARGGGRRGVIRTSPLLPRRAAGVAAPRRVVILTDRRRFRWVRPIVSMPPFQPGARRGRGGTEDPESLTDDFHIRIEAEEGTGDGACGKSDNHNLGWGESSSLSAPPAG